MQGEGWNEVKEAKVAKAERKDASVYKVAPNRPNMNKSNATGKAQASQDKTTKPSADKAKPGDAKKAEVAPIQGSLIPGTSVIMPFREGYDPNKAAKPSQPKQPDPEGNKAAA